MSRYFSTTARALLRFIWRGSEPVDSFENLIKDKVSRNPRLADADTVEIAGQPHTSRRDQGFRVSGQIYKGDKRLTSIHAYEDGRVVYSKDDYNNSQDE
ncbi:protein kinase [Fusarium bulbicola]|nr:protein kinase [Fusarium bulbicola]